MLRAAFSLTLASTFLFSAAALAQTSAAQDAAQPPPPYWQPEPCYEAETPVLLGSFLDSAGGTGTADTRIGTASRPITILTDPIRDRPPEPPRVQPIVGTERK